VLNMLLRKAVEWDAIERMPCTMRLLPIPKSSAGFYDFAEYERLVESATEEPNAYLIVLLGGDAGLRCGEMMALEWRDVDLGQRQIRVQRSEWKGHVSVPKGATALWWQRINRTRELVAVEPDSWRAVWDGFATGSAWAFNPRTPMKINRGS
jgi:integrase